MESLLKGKREGENGNLPVGEYSRMCMKERRDGERTGVRGQEKAHSWHRP